MNNNISKIFENYGKKENFFTQYKSLINFLQKIKFDDKSHYQLLSADAYAHKNLIDDGVDFFDKYYGFKLSIEHIMYGLFIPYIMEKLIVFTNIKGIEPLFLQNNISKIYNTFNELNNFSKSSGGEFSLNKFIFMMSYEQMYIQENSYVSDMLRLKNLYKDSSEVNQFIKEKFGLTFNKLIFLHWILFAYLIRDKKTTIYFSISDFSTFATGSSDFSISLEEVKLFLKYILIPQEEFREKYFDIRKNKYTGKFLSYERMTYLDRYLPRISYWYPLIKVEDKMMLVSYTSLLQFMKFDRLYSLIYHNNHIKDFKSKTHGHCVSDYIRSYAKNIVSHAKIYGDEEYYIGRDKVQAPDIIIEFDTYVLIIEAKSKPFDLVKALTDFDNYAFEKIAKDRDKSVKNINRYLEHKNAFDSKKIYRFVCYFFEHPVMLSDMDNIYDLKRILTTDVISIENLLSVKSKNYDVILEEFLESRKKQDTSTLSHYCKSAYGYELNDNHDEFDAFIKSFYKAEK